VSLDAVNYLVNIWFDFCSRQPQNRTQNYVVKFNISLFLFMFITENVCYTSACWRFL